MAPKRLLILTSATGAGHDTHAQATADWCRALFGAQVEVTIDHTLEDSHPFYRAGVDFYNYIQRRRPGLHHIYYNVVELLDLLNPGTVGPGRAYFVRLLERVRPDAILSVMDCLNRGYFELARQVLGPHVTCATFSTEFDGGYGFSRNWVNPRADYFFARTAEAAAEAVRRGLPASRARISGHWAPPGFYAASMSEVEKAAFLADKLQLDPGRFTLLLSTGGAGAHNHFDLLRALAGLGDRLQVVALCGRDSEKRNALEQWSRKLSFPVRALGHTAEMPALLQASSAVVARAGATTAGETLLCRCPVIFNALGGTMPQELPTLRYFRRHGIESIISQARQVTPLVRRWIEQPERLVNLRRQIESARDATTPESALRRLLAA